MHTIPETLLSLFPPEMRAGLFRHSRHEKVSRLATATEEVQPIAELSFESLWYFPAKREGGWQMGHQLNLIRSRPSDIIDVWTHLDIWQIHTDFWFNRHTPAQVIEGMRLPRVVDCIEEAGHDWGFTESYWRDSEYGYGTKADLEHGALLRFWKEDNFHQKLERYLAHKPLIEKFRALGFKVDVLLQEVLKNEQEP